MSNDVRLAELKVSDIRQLLVQNPSTIGPEATLLEVLREMEKDLRTRHVYVVDDDNRLLGTVRMGAVTEYLFPFDAVIEGHGRLYESYVPRVGAKSASDLMHTPAIKVYEDTSLGEMARLLMREAIYELPVVDKRERLIGQVNMYEVIKAYLSIEDSSLGE